MTEAAKLLEILEGILIWESIVDRWAWLSDTEVLFHQLVSKSLVCRESRSGLTWYLHTSFGNHPCQSRSNSDEIPTYRFNPADARCASTIQRLRITPFWECLTAKETWGWIFDKLEVDKAQVSSLDELCTIHRHRRHDSRQSDFNDEECGAEWIFEQVNMNIISWWICILSPSSTREIQLVYFVAGTSTSSQNLYFQFLTFQKEALWP